MGALPNSFPGYPSVNDRERAARSRRPTACRMPEQMGLRIPEMLDMAVYGKLKAMYVMGEDPVLTDADANHVRKALESLDFLVAQNIFMTETAKYADVFLPAACYAEKDGTFTNTERRVQRVRKAVDPPGQCRADWQIICDLSERLGHHMALSSPEEVFEEIRRSSPQYAGITYERLDTRAACSGRAPRRPSRHPVPAQGQVHARQGAAAGHPVRAAGGAHRRRVPDPAHHRPHAVPLQHHTRISASLEMLRPHELAEVNPADADRLGFEDGELVRVSSRRGSITTHITVTDKVAPGTVFMTFHYKESPVNELTNSAYDPVTKTAEFKVCAVKLTKLAEEEVAS